MRELDAVLTEFLTRGYPALDEADKSRFEALLDLPDPVLYAYLAGRSQDRDPNVARLIESIGASLRPMR